VGGSVGGGWAWVYGRVCVCVRACVIGSVCVCVCMMSACDGPVRPRGGGCPAFRGSGQRPETWSMELINSLARQLTVILGKVGNCVN